MLPTLLECTRRGEPSAMVPVASDGPMDVQLYCSSVLAILSKVRHSLLPVRIHVTCSAAPLHFCILVCTTTPLHER